MTSRPLKLQKLDPRTDLLLERIVDVPPDLVWRAWTESELLKQWFTPRPWKTVDAEIDLVPGGIFRIVMQSPEGQHFPYTSCYLEVVKNRRLIWTGLLGPGYRPNAWDAGAPVFTAALELTPEGTGTKYAVMVMHQDENSRVAHEKMGFHDGWGKALDQLVAHVKSL